MSIHTVVSVFIWANTDLDNVECQSHIPHAVPPKRENILSPWQEANNFLIPFDLCPEIHILCFRIE